MMKLITKIGIFSLIFAAVSAGQPIDAVAALNAALERAGLFPVTKKVQERICEVRHCGSPTEGRDCTKCRGQDIYRTSHEHLRVVGATSVVRVHDVQFGQFQEDEIPQRIRADSFRALNCGSAPITRTVNLTISSIRGNSVTVTRSITDAGNVTANFKLLGVGGTVNISRSVSLSSGETQTESETVSKSETIVQPVPPRKEVWGSLKIVERHHSVPFTARVVVDGSVTQNDRGVGSASSVLSEIDRTLVASGMLSIVSSSDATLEIHEGEPSCLAEMSEFAIERFAGPISAGVPPQLAVGVADSEPIVMEPPVYFRSKDEADRFLAMLKADNRQLGIESATPSFSAAGTHQCQSRTDIGHTCQVSGLAFSDCNEAYLSLKSQDCCVATELCTPNPDTGNVECRYGGSTIGFWMNYCIPY